MERARPVRHTVGLRSVRADVDLDGVREREESEETSEAHVCIGFVGVVYFRTEAAY